MGDDNMIPAWVNGRLEPREKLAVHRAGLRHPAVSVFVLGPEGLLIQRRALEKYHTPGLWANTCCTHPHWGEEPAACAARRLEQELGLTGLPLTHRGQVAYRAEVGGGLVEDEVVEIFTAPAGGAPVPNPAEVMDIRWVPLDELEAEIAADPVSFTPWLRIYLAQHRHLIDAAA